MAVDKLVIEVLAVDQAAVDPNLGLPATLTAQYNPSEVTISKAAQLAEIAIPGIDSPIIQFIRGQTQKLSFKLTFSTAEMGMGDKAQDVRQLTDPFYRLVKIQPKTHAAPRVRVSWGKGLTMQAIAESVDQEFTLFSPSGLPLRATLTISFREYKTLDEQLRELNLQSADQTKRRAVRRGDTLARIAWEELGDPTLWRFIADKNPDVDPIDPVPGAVLDVPALDASRSQRSRG
jgi:hypothetical protein